MSRTQIFGTALMAKQGVAIYQRSPSIKPTLLRKFRPHKARTTPIYNLRSRPSRKKSHSSTSSFHKPSNSKEPRHSPSQWSNPCVPWSGCYGKLYRTATVLPGSRTRRCGIWSMPWLHRLFRHPQPSRRQGRRVTAGTFPRARGVVRIVRGHPGVQHKLDAPMLLERTTSKIQSLPTSLCGEPARRSAVFHINCGNSLSAHISRDKLLQNFTWCMSLTTPISTAGP